MVAMRDFGLNCTLLHSLVPQVCRAPRQKDEIKHGGVLMLISDWLCWAHCSGVMSTFVNRLFVKFLFCAYNELIDIVFFVHDLEI